MECEQKCSVPLSGLAHKAPDRNASMLFPLPETRMVTQGKFDKRRMVAEPLSAWIPEWLHASQLRSLWPPLQTRDSLVSLCE